MGLARKPSDRMIQDARVLTPEFVPREIVHRDPEVNQLSNALEPITRGEPAETALCFGPSGAGKTCVAQFTVDRLRESVLDLSHQYVNCWEDYTEFRALYRILDGVGETFDVHRQSTPKDELVERLRAYDGPPYVVILDEVDQLEEKRLLYDLYRIPRLSMVLVANRERDLFARLDDRLGSRLRSATRIRFDPYGIDELTAILRGRVDRGLRDGVVDDDQLERIADAAAGDARVAIGILRNAARRARRQSHEAITGADLRAAIPEARSEIRQKHEDRLTDHQRAVYEVIAERGRVTPGELYEAYCERVENPRTRRTVRNYLSKLRQYDLVRAEGEHRGRTYRIPEQ